MSVFAPAEASPAPADPLVARRTTGDRKAFLLLLPFVICSYAIFRYRDVHDLLGNSAIDGQVFYQIVTWFVLGIVALFCVWSGRTHWTRLRSGPLLWFTAYSTFAVLSAVYTLDPTITMFRGGQLIIALVLIISLTDYKARFCIS